MLWSAFASDSVFVVRPKVTLLTFLFKVSFVELTAPCAASTSCAFLVSMFFWIAAVRAS